MSDTSTKPYDRIMGRDITFTGGRASWISRMHVDADGANGQTSKAAYGPNNSGLDRTANAGHPGDWWALVCDKAGNPLIQTRSQPAPGMYISMTGLRLLDANGKPFPEADTRSYIDSNAVPGIVIPRALAKKLPGIVLGCQAWVTNLSVKDAKPVPAVCYDTGPNDELGEGSIDLNRALGLNPNARGGGTEDFIIKVEFYPGVPAVVKGVKYPLQRL